VWHCVREQELTLNHPNIVNAKKNTELLYATAAAPLLSARGRRPPGCTCAKA